MLPATVAVAVRAAANAAPDLLLLVGGKSLGGRMVFFLQGTRDELADLKLLKPICKELNTHPSKPRVDRQRATLHVIETADHSFHVLKKSGRSDEEVLRELAETTAAWAEGK